MILPPWHIAWWFLAVLGAFMACVAILPLMASVPILIVLLYKGEHSLLSFLVVGPIAALAICLVYDLCKGRCVLMDWHGGTFLYAMGKTLTSGAWLLNIVVLGRARDVLRRVKADDRWMLTLERRWPFGWTQHKFTVPLDQIGPVRLRLDVKSRNELDEAPTSCVDFTARTPYSLVEFFPADAIAVAERLRQWEQDALSGR